ncbi:cytochrome c biogenesis protein ResB, partial [Microbacterium sp. Beta]
MRVSIRSEQAPQLPADHVDRPVDEPTNPRLSVSGWARWAWRQLTSMRTALVLLLLLAVAAIPGSLIPQRSSDPNGVIQFDKTNPGWMWAVDLLQLHDVFGSVWFSAIYLLLFASLIGC